MLDALKPTVAIEAEKDVIMTFGPWETDIYALEIENAYIDITDSGAWMFVAPMVDPDGKKITFSECIASAKSGALKTTYTNSKTGKEVILPGYAKALSLMHVAVDPNIADLTSCEVATKAVKVRKDGADVVVEKPCFVDLKGKKIHAAIQKEIVDKNKKNDVTGKYDIPDGTREQNTFEKFFDEDLRSVLEITEKKDAEFHEGWRAAFAGKTKNRAKNKPVTAQAGTAGAPAAPGAPATQQLSW